MSFRHSAPVRRAVLVGAAVLILAGAIGPASPAAGADHPRRPRGAFAAAVAAGDVDAIVRTLAPDVQLASPVLEAPFIGRARVTRLFRVLGTVFTDIHVVDRLRSARRHAVYFRAKVGTTPIEIVDLLEFDRHGRVRRITVTGRPASGVGALGAAVAPHLAEIG